MNWKLKALNHIFIYNWNKEGIPGRPIDYHLQPFVKEIPLMPQIQVTSYWKLTQLNLSQTVPILCHIYGPS